jgi:hypothetical protein
LKIFKDKLERLPQTKTAALAHHVRERIRNRGTGVANVLAYQTKFVNETKVLKDWP